VPSFFAFVHPLPQPSPNGPNSPLAHATKNLALAMVRPGYYMGSLARFLPPHARSSLSLRGFFFRPWSIRCHRIADFIVLFPHLSRCPFSNQPSSQEVLIEFPARHEVTPFCAMCPQNFSFSTLRVCSFGVMSLTKLLFPSMETIRFHCPSSSIIAHSPPRRPSLRFTSRWTTPPLREKSTLPLSVRPRIPP